MSEATEAAPRCPFGHGAEAPAGHHGYEPFQMKDPFPAYAELRAEQPVMFDERTGYYVVSRYDDIKAVFDDWETFSSENAQAPGPRAWPPGQTDHGGGRVHRLLRAVRTPPAGAHPHPRGGPEGVYPAPLQGPGAVHPAEHRGPDRADAGPPGAPRRPVPRPRLRRPDHHHPHADRRGHRHGRHLQALVRLPGRDDLGRPERRGADPARAQPRRVLAGMPAPGRPRQGARRRQPHRGHGKAQAEGAEISDHEIASLLTRCSSPATRPPRR